MSSYNRDLGFSRRSNIAFTYLSWAQHRPKVGPNRPIRGSVHRISQNNGTLSSSNNRLFRFCALDLPGKNRDSSPALPSTNKILAALPSWKKMGPDFIRWAHQYESLHPVGPSIQKPSSGGPVNAKDFIRWARQHESPHPMGPSIQKPDGDGDVDDVGDDCSSSISIYTNSRSTALAAGTC